METNTTTIQIQQTIHAPVEKVWEYFSKPEHITQWNNASEDWFTPRAQNDLREGGTFVYRMESREGKYGFDFGGTYNKVVENKSLEYTIGDGRKVIVNFIPEGNATRIEESFEAENQHPVEMQQEGWQSILDNFKKYTESN
jgi:uncharacterized protein YndB with AHSA1/START domain